MPWGLRKLLSWIKRNFQDPDIYITENGVSEHDYDGLDDEIRVNYYKNYINEVLKGTGICRIRLSVNCYNSIVVNQLNILLNCYHLF